MKTHLKTTRFQQPDYVPAMPNPSTTTTGQKMQVRLIGGSMIDNACTIIDKRNGQGKPCAADVAKEFLSCLSEMQDALESGNHARIRAAYIDGATRALAEMGEHSYAQVA